MGNWGGGYDGLAPLLIHQHPQAHQISMLWVGLVHSMTHCDVEITPEEGVVRREWVWLESNIQLK